MTANNYCGWCRNWWAEKHECRALSTFTLPCYRCGCDVATKPSGYGLSAETCAAAVVRDNEREVDDDDEVAVTP